MSGQTMSSAKSALQQALQMLTENDYFTICAFDDKMTWFQCPLGSAPVLSHADRATISLACQWIESIEAAGLTCLISPYQIATSLLLNPKTQNSAQYTQKSGPYKVNKHQHLFTSFFWLY